jgi:hypothetical protein
VPALVRVARNGCAWMESAAAAYGLYLNHIDVAEIVRALNAAGFSHQNICLFLSPSYAEPAVLAQLGFPESEAQRFALELKSKASLVYVMSSDLERAKWAMEILRSTRASETGTFERIKKRSSNAGAAA